MTEQELVIIEAVKLISRKGYKLHSTKAYYQLLAADGQLEVLFGTAREKGFEFFLHEVWRRYGLQQE